MPMRIVGVWLLLAGLAVAAPRPTRKPESKRPEILVQADKAVAAAAASLKEATQQADQARAQKDIIKLNCVNDKLVQLKGHARLASQLLEQIERGLARRQAIDEQHERARLTIIIQKCAVLAAEAAACVGDEVAPGLERTVVTVEIDRSVKLSPAGLGGEDCPLAPSAIKLSQPRPGSKPGETVVHIVHRNQMGRCFRLVKVAVSLDGKTLVSRAGDQLPHHAVGGQLVLHTGPVRAGTHVLMVLVVYQGQGQGRLAHLGKVTFSLRGGHSFEAAAGKTTVIDVVSHEKGKPRTPVGDRPALRYDLQVMPTR